MQHYLIIIASAVFLSGAAAPAAIAQDPIQPSVKIIYSDGSYYEGHLKDNSKHGAGRHVAADGSEYQGMYVHGKPHGEGIFSYPDGRRKKVLFDNGRLVESRFINHDSDENGCVYGEFEYSGRYSGWFRGNKIKGFVPHGRGIMKYSNGSMFSGQWENGRMHGNGTVRWEDGSMYSGQWVNGKRTGYGTYTWPNGESYVGEWKENQICGTGIYHYENGTISKGTWEEKTVFMNK
jgi:hypothetical protein